MLRRRITYAILVSLACVNLVVRYPETPHEIGVDSFVWHGMATSLQQNGMALWVLNPLSYVGLYPLSHPSGSPFLLVAFSGLSGNPIEGAVVWVDMVVALMSLLAAFALGWEFTRSEPFALFLATVLSLTPEMISALNWQVPTRIMFTALLPVLLWVFIRLGRRPARSLVVILGTIFFLMMSFHRLTILVALIVIAYVMTGILLTVLRTFRVKSPQVFLQPKFVRRAPVIALVAVAVVSFGTLFATDVLDEYSSGVLASGDSRTIQLLNLGVSLARNSGLLLPIALLGIVGVALRHYKSYAEPFVIIAFIAFLPMLFLRQYTGYYTVPFTALFITFGFFVILKRIKSQGRRAVVSTATALFVLITSGAISGYDLSMISHMPSDTYNTALYARYHVAATIVTNEGLAGSRMHAISGGAYLPVGGATTAFQSPELLMFGFMSPEEVLRNVAQIPPSQLTIESDSLFVLLNVQAEADWASIMSFRVGDIPRSYDRYHLAYALESKSLAGQYTAYGNIYDAPLLQSAHELRYKVYESEGSVVFFLGEA